MSDVSANLSIPYIQASQAQKHVTHNEGMRRLDALVQLSVLAADEVSPPSAPDDGVRYMLPTGATGEWAGEDGKIAVFEGGAWVFYAPNAGWVAWVVTPGELRAFDGTDWVLVSGLGELQNLDFVGVGTTADATNRLAVASDATLLTHAGSDHQLKINKADASDTASLLFQTNWSGRAEIGTTGSEDFEIKVSDDGSTFYSSIIADAGTGVVRFPSGVEGLTSPEFGDGALVTTDYAASMGVNLIANSSGLLGNGYNYPADFTFDPTISPDLPASFQFAGYYQGVEAVNNLFPVDPNKVYRTDSYIRQEGLAGDWSTYTYEERHRQYMGLSFFDADKKQILAEHHKRFKHGGVDSLTTLAAPLSPGDTTVSVVDASGWNEAVSTSTSRGVIIFGYKNSHGLVHDYYSQIVEFGLFDLGQVDKATHVITLNGPLPASMGNPDDVGGTWPIGTRIANSLGGYRLKYAFCKALYVPEADQWYQASGYIGGIDTSGTNYEFNFPPGTAYVQSQWLPNYTNRAGGYSGHPDTGAGHKIWYSGASITVEPLAIQSVTLTGANAGRKEIKVSSLDYDAGTVTLIPAARSITAV